jgi:tetratricopeptide (TPR) repeat protein
MIKTDVLLHEALALHQAGDLPAARKRYEQVLADHPKDANALHLLGVLLGAQGEHDKAVALIKQATKVHPGFAIAFFNLGNLQHTIGRQDDALTNLDCCLALLPDHLGALSASGRSLLVLGRHPEAVERLQRAIHLSEQDARLWTDLGTALLGNRQIVQALEAYRRSVSLAPNYVIGHRNLGYALLAAGLRTEAIASYETALRLAPGDADAMLSLALILQEEGQTEAALNHLKDLLDRDPHHPRARLLHARALARSGRHAEALAGFDAILTDVPDDLDALCGRSEVHWMRLDADAAEADLDRALAIDPSFAPALSDRGNLRMDAGDFTGALAEYEAALALTPGNPATLVNRAAALLALRRYEEGLADYDASLAAAPLAATTRMSRGICLLAAGRWDEGWQDFEARLSVPHWATTIRELPAPLWDGTMDLAGKRILVAGEQGLGDMIQFSRFAPRLTALGAHVVLGVEPPLRRLMQTLDGIESIVTPEDSPDVDLACLMMSLMPLLHMTEADFTMDAPYLRAEEATVATWRDRLAAYPGRKIGLAWAGDPRPENRLSYWVDRRRSVTLDRLAPLLALPGVTFVSLQKGAAAEQAKGKPILDWTEELNDFADTAALIAALDLVISVDTSVLHAAGALGKPVWAMNRYDTCWRWRSTGDRTLWYPSLRLFTQVTPGDWDEVTGRIVSELIPPDRETSQLPSY